MPKTIKEIGQLMDVDTSIIMKTRKYFDNYDISSTKVESDDSSGFVEQYLNKLLLSRSDKSKLKKELISLCKMRLLEGKTPHTKLVTFIYYLIHDEYSKKEICAIYDISIVTLNKSYKELLKINL